MLSLFLHISLMRQLECYLQPPHLFLALTWPLLSAGVLAALAVCLVSETLSRVLSHTLKSSSSCLLALARALQPMQWDPLMIKDQACHPSKLLMDQRASVESHVHELRYAICARRFGLLSLGLPI